MSKSKYTPNPRSGKVDTGSFAPASAGSAPAWMRTLPAVLIVATVVAVYANSLRGPFIFDDVTAIVENPSIRKLWSFEIFNPPGGRGETTGGRPLLNASFAVNHAISGLETWSYHATNVAIHAMAALLLFGLARRTVPKNGAGNRDTWFAAAVALVWATHPLCTGAVSYVAQRAESLCGLFFLLALYCFARVPEGRRWLAASAGACFAGVATKEVAATLPMIVFLYDRTFVAGSFGAAWRARRGYYLALMASWILLAALMLGQGGRGMSAGFASGTSWVEYAFTQCWAVAHYLRLAFWPAGQLFDHGLVLVRGLRDVWPQALVLACLFGATLWALARKPAAGFLGAWFFVILAPTSSVVPVVTQTVAEHRMYLPLIAVAALVLAVLRVRARAFFPAATVVLVVSLGAAAIARNATYRSGESVWRDVTEKNPASARAWANLGAALQQAGNDAGAVSCYERAVGLNPNHAFAHGNWGGILLREGKAAEAIPHLRIAAKLEPDASGIRAALGFALASEGKAMAMGGRLAEAETLLREAVAAQPGNVEAHGNLGNVLLMQERAAEAIRQYEEVLRLKPGDRGARENIELARELLRK